MYVLGESWGSGARACGSLAIRPGSSKGRESIVCTPQITSPLKVQFKAMPPDCLVCIYVPLHSETLEDGTAVSERENSKAKGFQCWRTEGACGNVLVSSHNSG